MTTYPYALIEELTLARAEWDKHDHGLFGEAKSARDIFQDFGMDIDEHETGWAYASDVGIWTVAGDELHVYVDDEAVKLNFRDDRVFFF